MTRNKFLLPGVVLALVVMACVAAAASEGKTGTGAGTQATGEVTLAGWASSPTETKLLKQVIRGFEKTFPSVKVNYTPISGDFTAAMLAKFSARTPPDVLYVDSNVAPDWIKQKVLAAARSVHREEQVEEGAVLSLAPERLHGAGQEDLRLPEGLVAARDGDQHPALVGCGREGADDVGAAHRRGEEAAREGPGRSPDLPLARAGTGCSRSSTRTAARS